MQITEALPEIGNLHAFFLALSFNNKTIDFSYKVKNNIYGRTMIDLTSKYNSPHRIMKTLSKPGISGWKAGIVSRGIEEETYNRIIEALGDKNFSKAWEIATTLPPVSDSERDEIEKQVNPPKPKPFTRKPKDSVEQLRGRIRTSALPIINLPNYIDYPPLEIFTGALAHLRATQRADTYRKGLHPDDISAPVPSAYKNYDFYTDAIKFHTEYANAYFKIRNERTAQSIRNKSNSGYDIKISTGSSGFTYSYDIGEYKMVDLSTPPSTPNKDVPVSPQEPTPVEHPHIYEDEGEDIDFINDDYDVEDEPDSNF
jgi:hypothetical protein